MSCKTSGRRVTIPEPRGKKSRPTKFSKTDDFPADCPPTTAICGKSKDILTPNDRSNKCHALVVHNSDSLLIYFYSFKF